MNRKVIELLALNVTNPTENWDLNIGLVLIAYRSAPVFNRLHTAVYSFRARNAVATRRYVLSTRRDIHEILLPERGSQDADGRLRTSA